MTPAASASSGDGLAACFSELVGKASPTLAATIPGVVWIALLLFMMGLAPFARPAWLRIKQSGKKSRVDNEEQVPPMPEVETPKADQPESVSSENLSEGKATMSKKKLSDVFQELFRKNPPQERLVDAGPSDNDPPSTADSFIGHLIELRGHVVRVLGWVLAMFFLLTGTVGALELWCGGTATMREVGLVFFTGAGAIYSALAAPLLESLPESGALIAINTVSPVFVPMKAAFFVAVCALMPYILYEMWSFVAPGLYRHEQGIAFWVIVSGAALFYLGMVFAYFAVFQIVFGVIAAVTPEAVNWTPDINELFGFMLLLFFVFGLAFEIPVAEFILVRAGVVELEDLKRARPWVIVGAFVVAAVVTPPDVLSQFLLAIPCWLLYEVGLWFAPKRGRKKG